MRHVPSTRTLVMKESIYFLIVNILMPYFLPAHAQERLLSFEDSNTNFTSCLTVTRTKMGGKATMAASYATLSRNFTLCPSWLFLDAFLLAMKNSPLKVGKEGGGGEIEIHLHGSTVYVSLFLYFFVT